MSNSPLVSSCPAEDSRILPLSAIVIVIDDAEVKV